MRENNKNHLVRGAIILIGFVGVFAFGMGYENQAMESKVCPNILEEKKTESDTKIFSDKKTCQLKCKSICLSKR